MEGTCVSEKEGEGGRPEELEESGRREVARSTWRGRAGGIPWWGRGSLKGILSTGMNLYIQSEIAYMSITCPLLNMTQAFPNVILSRILGGKLERG